METDVTFDTKGLQLEGRLYKGLHPKGAVIAHPHPLYGGDMDNAVVVALARAYQDAGWSTLRFNFRGTGQSQGQYDNGVGEQDDIQAAVACLQADGLDPIHLVGYSFGAWALARWCQQHNQAGHPIYLVSPPVAFMEFPDGPLPGLKAVFTGRRDDLAPPDQVESHLNQWCPNTQFTIIEQADHFFQAQLEELCRVFSRSIHRCRRNDPI